MDIDAGFQTEFTTLLMNSHYNSKRAVKEDIQEESADVLFCK